MPFPPLPTKPASSLRMPSCRRKTSRKSSNCSPCKGERSARNQLHLHLGKLFQVISASALQLTKAPSARLFLLDDEGKALSMVSSSAARPSRIKRLRLAGRRCGRFSRPRRANRRAGADQRRRPGPARAALRRRGCPRLAAPLISEKRVLGVLHVASDQSGAFSEDDLKLLMIFAGHSASPIKNVRLLRPGG